MTFRFSWLDGSNDGHYGGTWVDDGRLMHRAEPVQFEAGPGVWTDQRHRYGTSGYAAA